MPTEGEVARVMDTVPITILFTVSRYLPLTINNLGWVYKGKNAFLSFMLLFSASWQQSCVGKGWRRDAARKAWPPSSGTLSPVAPTLSPAPGPLIRSHSTLAWHKVRISIQGIGALSGHHLSLSAFFFFFKQAIYWYSNSLLVNVFYLWSSFLIDPVVLSVPIVLPSNKLSRQSRHTFHHIISYAFHNQLFTVAN